jgi:hypothetical protein
MLWPMGNAATPWHLQVLFPEHYPAGSTSPSTAEPSAACGTYLVLEWRLSCCAGGGQRRVHPRLAGRVVVAEAQLRLAAEAAVRSGSQEVRLQLQRSEPTRLSGGGCLE